MGTEMKKLNFAGLIAAALACAATPSFAGVDMNAVAAAAAKPMGPGSGSNTVETQTNGDGGTILRVTLPGGFRYVIVNDLCASAGNCDRLGFIVIYNASAGDYSLDTINQWNALRPPQAFKSAAGETIMAHYVLARGGMAQANIDMNFEFWNDSIFSFNNYLSNAPKGVTVSVSAQSPALTHSAVSAWFDHEVFSKDDANGKLMLPD